MKSRLIFSAVLVVMLAALMMLFSGCFTNTSSSTPTTSSSEAIKPKPVVQKVVATTSGTEAAYFATLDISVKNEGAEGTILVIGSVTQGGRTAQNEMPVFLKEGQSHELKLTFPLVWKGGDFTSNVKTVVP
jgi:N-methylhydantoinase B/oxoprolinase/acetone carboxylase alpha subunit